MAKERPISSKQGKAVSAKNVIIAANKILQDYEREPLQTNDEHFEQQQSTCRTSSEASNSSVRKRLDRRDRSVEVQNACNVFENMEAESFKETCRQLNISPVTLTYIRNVLQRKESILNLRNHGIGPTCALTIVNELIDSAECINELDLASNNLGDQGTEAVCQFLKNNDSVVRVDLARNSLSKAGVDAVAHMLAQNETIKHLVLSHNALTEEDFELIVCVLQTHQMLRTLDFSSNSFSPESGHLFGILVAKNVTLMKLNISCNHIGDDGVHSLVSGLIDNRTIQSLDLSWNDITDGGALRMADVLTSNNILRELNLSYNRIASKGVNYIAKSLEVNVTLNLLEISGNCLISEDAVSLLDSLLKNSSMKLRHLCLGEVIISADIQLLLHKLCSMNPKFKIWGIIGAAGQPIRLTSTNKAMEALEEYFAKNKLDATASFLNE